MKHTAIYRLLPLALLPLFLAADWPAFRGAASNSVAEGPAPPVKWTVEIDGTGENVAWRVDLPGRGPASPIVVGGRVIVSASSGPKQDRLHVLAYDEKTGALQWHRQFWATGRTLGHPQTANAAPTPASDGQRVYVFSSSNDLICLNLAGDLQWYRGLAYDWPKAGNDVGMSSSPAVSGKLVIVQVECQGESFAAAIDGETGETAWKIAREQNASWSSPVVLHGKTPGDDVVVLQSPSGLTAVAATTGAERWKYAKSCDGISSAAPSGNKLFVPSSGLTALELTTTEPTVAWNAAKLNPGAASPVVYQDRVFVVNRAGVVSCAQVKDGSPAWQLRLKGPFWATPAVADGHMFLVNFDGAAQVVKLGEKQGELVGGGDFKEQIQASPVIANGAIFVRSDAHLWKIAAPR